MTVRLAALALAPLFVSSIAAAQAPGQWAEPPPPYPAYEPPPPPPAVASAPRWSVGVSIGQTEITDGYSEVLFDAANLALRYRAWQHLELELTLGGGRQTYADAMHIVGDLAMSTGTLAARYRFNPHRPWNWWLLAGLGASTIAPYNSTRAEREGLQRAHAAVGVGVEKRWVRFALQFELRALAVGQSEDEMALAEQGYDVGDGLSGGAFSLGASYYF